jgi:hypothetical protein
MCAEGLVCHEAECRPDEEVRVTLEAQRQTKEAVDGFRTLVRKCKTLYPLIGQVNRLSQEFEAGTQAPAGSASGREAEAGAVAEAEAVAEAVAVAGTEAVLGAGADGTKLGQFMEAYWAVEEARNEAQQVGVPLRDENPVFKLAVRQTIRQLTPPDQPGPASSLDIEFCGPDFLEALWQNLGEPPIYGVTK